MLTAIRRRELAGWTLDPAYADDPRTPERGESAVLVARLNPLRRGAGPWQHDGRPAHGILARAGGHGLTDWVAAIDGWVVARWSGPRMYWSSPLVSPWNPLLAQARVMGAFVDPGDPDWWTAEALLSGEKPAGYFALRPRRHMRRWVQDARAAGLVVRFDRRRCWAYAARSGALGDVYDLDALAAEYRRVLPRELAGEHLTALADLGDLDLLSAAEQHEEHSEVIGGLALGYPPEVTAGWILSVAHRIGHVVQPGLEDGAYCRFCRRSALGADVGPRRGFRQDMLGGTPGRVQGELHPVV